MDRSYSNRRDWKCLRCDSVNWGRNGKCYMCHARKPSTLLEGDWFCSACDSYQFKSRTRCRECGNRYRAVIDETDDDSGPSHEGDEYCDDDKKACVICLTNKRKVTFVHGGTSHFVSCYGCASKVKNCPICRKPISSKITVYD